jgi:hypothetical protein
VVKWAVIGTSHSLDRQKHNLLPRRGGRNVKPE